MSAMTHQLRAVQVRDGHDAMIDYARRTLSIYRECARPRRDGKKHFAHIDTFRPHFVRSILQIRALLRGEQAS